MEAARAWLAAQGDAKTFVWVHLYEPHFPYAPPEPFASRFANDLYHGEVSYADALLQPLLEPLLATGQDPRSLVVLTADHGEGLGEHGEATHGIFAYEATLRVPLILHAPGLLRPRVVADRVRHIDLLPTVLDALGLEAPAGSARPQPPRRGQRSRPRSLPELLRGHVVGPEPWLGAPGRPGPRRTTSSSTCRFPSSTTSTAIPTRPGTWPPPSRSGSRRSGPSSRACARPIRGLTRPEESAETRERLQALGYLAALVAPLRSSDGTRTPTIRSGSSGSTPSSQEVVTLYQAGDIGSAMLKAQQVVAERPDMALALQHLGFLQREAGEIEAAVAYPEASRRRQPRRCERGGAARRVPHTRRADSARGRGGAAGRMPSVPSPTSMC